MTKPLYEYEYEVDPDDPEDEKIDFATLDQVTIRFTLGPHYAEPEKVVEEIGETLEWLTPEGGHHAIYRMEVIDE